MSLHPESCRGPIAQRIKGLDVADILEITEGRLTVLVKAFFARHALTNDL